MVKPSEVTLWRFGHVPLGDTMHRLEREVAAACIVSACAKRGDAWQPFTPQDLMASMKEDSLEEPWASLWSNPFVRVDFRDLASAGYARFLGDPEGVGTPIELTTEGLAALPTKGRPHGA
jgi:hypothetical protein